MLWSINKFFFIVYKVYIFMCFAVTFYNFTSPCKKRWSEYSILCLGIFLYIKWDCRITPVYKRHNFTWQSWWNHGDIEAGDVASSKSKKNPDQLQWRWAEIWSEDTEPGAWMIIVFCSSPTLTFLKKMAEKPLLVHNVSKKPPVLSAGFPRIPAAECEWHGSCIDLPEQCRQYLAQVVNIRTAC